MARYNVEAFNKPNNSGEQGVFCLIWAFVHLVASCQGEAIRKA